MAVRWVSLPFRLGRTAITAVGRLLGLGSRQLASWLVAPEDIRLVALLGVSDVLPLPGGGTPTGRDERNLGSARIVANQRGMLTAMATMLVEGPASVARLQLYFDDVRMARSAQQGRWRYDTHRPREPCRRSRHPHRAGLLLVLRCTLERF